MSTRYLYSSAVAAAMACLLTAGISVAQGQSEPTTQDPSAQDSPERERSAMAQRSARDDDRAEDAQEQVEEAVEVVNQMKRDPQLTAMLERAQGVFIVPDFTEAALGAGGSGGEGVLLVKRNGEWSGPAFYNFGRISAGPQAGVDVDAVAMLLMTQDAVRPFTSQSSNFSLDAEAGLTIVNYSADARTSAKEPDVVMWSDTEGLFAGASIGVSGFTRDEEDNRAYYMKRATPQEIFSGRVKNPHATTLREALPTKTAAR